MDAITMQQACESTERVVEHITPDTFGRPTPCSDWDVRDVLNHLLATLTLGRAALSGTSTDLVPGELPPTDLVGDDPLKAYRVRAEALLEAASGDALARTLATPLGDRPGAVFAGFVTLDIAVHGWDLAKATGQDPTLDPALAEAVLGFAQQTLTDAMREPRIGPAITVAPGAPVSDRLVAFLGRTP